MSQLVEIHLGGLTPYEDYPPIPERFSRDFKLWVFDPDEGGGMKVHEGILGEGELDNVSEAIATYGVWEVPETITLSSAFAAAPFAATFIDIGSHVGWFSAVAASHGLDVIAVDADGGALELLQQTWLENGFKSQLALINEMVDTNTEWHFPVPTAIVKMDIEGAESHAVGALWPLFEDGTITHCMMEVSPCFNDGYPDLLRSLFRLGYVGHVMPRKRIEPYPVGDDLYKYLSVYARRLDVMAPAALTNWITRQWQINVVLFKPESAWG
ncbi:MAG TPA: hypothetical protein VIV08_03285 [Acidimicrobiia bacterium]